MSAHEVRELGLDDGLDHGGCRGGHADVLDSGVMSTVGVCARAPHPHLDWHHGPAWARLPTHPFWRLLMLWPGWVVVFGERLP